jgi:glucose-1-phosphate cytidylyltransferase
MKTVILCGGQGTRIRDVADNIPKPMITIGRHPILWHIMNYYAAAQHFEFILCLGHQSNVIKDFFINYHLRTADLTISLGDKNPTHVHSNHNEENWKISLVETGLNTMTGTRIKKVESYVNDDENFMLTYGDGVGDIDISALIKFHKSHGKTMTVTGVRPPGRFGELKIKGDRVAGFNEKPQASAGRISGGFFVCNRNIFDYLNNDDDLIFEGEPMERLAREGELMAYRHDGFWHPMDTYRDYKLLNELWESNKAPWKI